nr:ricin lectin domain-containing protein 5 [Arenicola marina]
MAYQAYPPPEYYAATGVPPPEANCFYIQSVMHNHVLGVKAASAVPGTHVVITLQKSYPTWRDDQLWFEDHATGSIRSRMNQFCLDIGDNCTLVVNPLQPGSMTQQFMRLGDYIQNRHDANKVVDVANCNRSIGARVIVWQRKGGIGQMWRYPQGNVISLGTPSQTPFPHPTSVPAPYSAPIPVLIPDPLTSLVAAGRKKTRQPATVSSSSQSFYIRSHLNGKVLDVKGGSTAPGTPVIMWQRKPGAANNQLWYLGDQNVIFSTLNGMALKNNGTYMCLTPYDPQGNQRWALVGERIINLAHPHRCLDISGANSGDGAKVIAYDYKGSSNQHWATDG